MKFVIGFLAMLGGFTLLFLAIAFFFGENAETKLAAPIVQAENAPLQVQSASAELIPANLLDRPPWVGDKPYDIPMIATGISVIPGAILCSNFDSVQGLFELYVQSWGDHFAPAPKLHGAPAPRPNPTDFGCLLMKPGQRVQIVKLQQDGIPDVRMQLPDGRSAYGVTLPAMLLTEEKWSAIRQTDNAGVGR